MPQRGISAAFMRGGTSKAIMFRQADLPADRAAWDSIFTAAMGSPDPYGRQLNGMGGGVSSLSKICVIQPSARADADVDYTFAQLAIRDASVDYKGNCGNMSSAVGPFAVEEGMVSVPAGASQAVVRIFNTNTGKIIHARFPVEGGMPRYDGDCVIPGVAGSGAPIRLDFLNPGGATTGRLLPTGLVRERLAIAGFGPVEASLVDAGNATVFVRAAEIGLLGTEMPDALDSRPDVLALLDAIRIEASLRMGISHSLEEARSIRTVPYVGFVSAPCDSASLTGAAIAADQTDLLARVISNGQPHRALPLTASLCLATAARITGSVVADCLRPGAADKIRIGMPSGILEVDADVAQDGGAWVARSGAYLRTARRLFEGRVLVPG